VPVNKLSRLYKSGRWSYIERSIFAERAKSIIGVVKPDLVYTRDLVCAYRFVRARLPVMYEVHDLESKHPGEGKSANLIEQLKRMDEETLRGARGIVSLTETFRQEVIANGWQPAARVFVIPDAYDDAVYMPRDKTAARSALHLPHDAHLVMYAGLTFKYRGLDGLLRAFQQLDDRHAQLVLIGGRDFEVQELREQAQALGLGEKVRFVRRQPAEVIAQYLAAADVLVIPDTVTDATASPLKMFEYMAVARPVVCVDRASLREILGNAALYFPRGDTAAFAAALRAALAPEAHSLGEQARTRVAEFTYKRRAEKIVRAAQDALNA
jgi:glycosyltransferase involved in cell wall biosynthesis